MQKKNQQGVEWLEFDLLSDIPGLRHASFLRHGGTSEGDFKSLNASYNVGDDPQHVKANLDLIQQCFKQDTQQDLPLFWARQCHSKEIAHIQPHSPQETPSCDALVTNTPGLTLMIRHADCQAAIFYDPVHRVIANVHAGWRGNVENIYAETIQYLQKNFDSKPSELLVCISPSLGPDDAEFVHYKHEFPPEFWEFQTRPTYFDLWAISEYQLHMAGVLSHHIEMARISTYANPYDYFSYRLNKHTGRLATCVALT